MADLKQVDEALNQYLRLQTFPVAVRMCESEEELPDRVRIPQRDLGITISLCHAIALARRYGWVMAVDKYQSCYAAGLSLGFLPLLPDIVDGSYQASFGIWGMTKEEAAASIEDMPKFEYGKYQYALIAPLQRATFEPHVVMVYANPAQIWVLLSAYLSGTGKRGGLDITLTAGGGCQSYITRAMQTDEAKFTLIGTGERLGPNAQDYECAFSIPFSKIEQTVQGLEQGYKDGVHRYPIPGFLRYSSNHPPGYTEIRNHLLGEDA
jgi:uncharacterized protein (DUF169 family)